MKEKIIDKDSWWKGAKFPADKDSWWKGIEPSANKDSFGGLIFGTKQKLNKKN